ncbi:hypothetical protein [Roseibium salinum]|uniref:L-idonate 5-dehydrogenase n=1 Tax=Roseibium salinum TaxID=1604349 RepID=A0ABT3R9T9_9HYPH|nr:hypothetical protein [Roseibium sp. DSM 29163]MCX2725809.1 hypothetical protein [Roseibium sp. DSM 29163]MDN3720375.1 hypothetical protein [Roseibium salinum]
MYDIPRPLKLVLAKEFILRGSFRFGAEFEWAVELLSSGAIDLSSVILAMLPAERANEAFGLASDRCLTRNVQLAFNG